MITATVHIVGLLAYWVISVDSGSLEGLYGIPKEYSLRVDGIEVNSHYDHWISGTVTPLNPIDDDVQMELRYVSPIKLDHIGVYNKDVLYYAYEIKFDIPPKVTVTTVKIENMVYECHIESHGDSTLRIVTTPVPMEDGVVPDSVLSKLRYIVTNSGRYISPNN